MNDTPISTVPDPAAVAGAADWAAPEDVGAVVAAYDEAGLEMPFLPAPLLARMEQTGPGFFSSDPRLSSWRGGIGPESWRTDFPDGELLAYGFAGYGYAGRRWQAAVAGPALALAGELPFGNVYADAEQERWALRRCWTRLARMYRLTEGCRALPGHPGERWVVVAARWGRDSFWRRIGPDGRDEIVEGGDAPESAWKALTRAPAAGGRTALEGKRS